MAESDTEIFHKLGEIGERVVPATTPVAWKVLLGVAFCAVWQIDWRSVREGSTLIPIHTKVYNDGVLVMPATGGNNAD